MAQQMTSQTLRIIGLALTYPTSGLLEAAGEMQGLLECEGWLPAGAAARCFCPAG
jgi:hypothetical protein